MFSSSWELDRAVGELFRTKRDDETHPETALATARAIVVAQRADDLVGGVGEGEGRGEGGALGRHGGGGGGDGEGPHHAERWSWGLGKLGSCVLGIVRVVRGAVWWWRR